MSVLTDEEIQQIGATPTELVLAPKMSIRREWDSRLSFARAIEKAVLLKLMDKLEETVKEGEKSET